MMPDQIDARRRKMREYNIARRSADADGDHNMSDAQFATMPSNIVNATPTGHTPTNHESFLQLDQSAAMLSVVGTDGEVMNDAQMLSGVATTTQFMHDAHHEQMNLDMGAAASHRETSMQMVTHQQEATTKRTTGIY
jgi:hypothetical protein